MGYHYVAAHYPDFAEDSNAMDYLGTAAMGNLDNEMDPIDMCWVGTPLAASIHKGFIGWYILMV
jgi:hypothetical protein